MSTGFKKGISPYILGVYWGARMDNIISMPTGLILEKMMQRNKIDLKKYFSRYNISGLELTMAFKNRLYKYKPNKVDLDWIKGLDYVSVHAPFKLVSSSENKSEQIKQLDALDLLYNKVNAKTLVVHVHECPDEDLLDNYNFNIALENMPIKEKLNNSEMTNKIAKSKYGFCLDTAHADDFGKTEISKLYEKLGHKLRQMHLSASIKNKHHKPLTVATKSFLRSLRPVFKSKVPLIMEMAMPSFSKARVNKEIKYIKKQFVV